MTTNSGIPDDALQPLRSAFRGELIRPGESGYDGARAIWNGMIDKRPALIARCREVADVIEAVRFARARSLPTAIRGGGHNVAGNALCEGGLVIDLSLMKAVRVDARARTARAEGGVTWGEFDRETQVFGLATTGGLITSTGIAGLTLGGGIGWLMREHGLTCDNLLSADVVTAARRPSYAFAAAIIASDVTCPMTADTLRSSTNVRAICAARLASPRSSASLITSLCPFTPPAALISFNASSIPSCVCRPCVICQGPAAAIVYGALPPPGEQAVATISRMCGSLTGIRRMA